MGVVLVSGRILQGPAGSIHEDTGLSSKTLLFFHLGFSQMIVSDIRKEQSREDSERIFAVVLTHPIPE